MAANDIVTPIMPTGSGVVDLEIARERDALDGNLEETVAPEQPSEADAASGPAAESEAHPS